MSFLNLRGKMIHCSNCDKTATVEYEGGNRLTQIGDVNVMEQEELNKRYMPSSYDYQQEGYYFHSTAICKNCLESDSQLAKESVLLEPDYLLLTFLSETQIFTSMLSRIIDTCADEYCKDFSVDKLKRINNEGFNYISGTKTFGLKKEKKRLSTSFAYGSCVLIEKDLKKFISESDAYLNLAARVKMMHDNYTIAAMEDFDFSKNIYIRIDPTANENLNDYISTEMTVRTGAGATDCIDFYDGPVKFDEVTFWLMVDDHTKYTLDSTEAQKKIHNLEIEIIRRLEQVMWKMDFWI